MRLRHGLLIFCWFSLLIVVYVFFEVVCYTGLCGGAASKEIAERFLTFYTTFLWVYPIVTLLSIFASALLKYKYYLSAVACLCIPIISLLPFLYVEYVSYQINLKYKKQHDSFIIAQPEDYICNKWKFVRRLPDSHYIFFSKDPESGVETTAYYDSYATLTRALKNNFVDIFQCQNTRNQHIPK